MSWFVVNKTVQNLGIPVCRVKGGASAVYLGDPAKPSFYIRLSDRFDTDHLVQVTDANTMHLIAGRFKFVRQNPGEKPLYFIENPDASDLMVPVRWQLRGSYLQLIEGHLNNPDPNVANVHVVYASTSLHATPRAIDAFITLKPKFSIQAFFQENSNAPKEKLTLAFDGKRVYITSEPVADFLEEGSTRVSGTHRVGGATSVPSSMSPTSEHSTPAKKEATKANDTFNPKDPDSQPTFG